VLPSHTAQDCGINEHYQPTISTRLLIVTDTIICRDHPAVAGQALAAGVGVVAVTPGVSVVAVLLDPAVVLLNVVAVLLDPAVVLFTLLSLCSTVLLETCSPRVRTHVARSILVYSPSVYAPDVKQIGAVVMATSKVLRHESEQVAL